MGLTQGRSSALVPGGVATATVVVVAAAAATPLLVAGSGTALRSSFLFSVASRFPELTGIAAALVGTLWLVLMATLVAVPLGVGTAVFLREYAPRNRIATLLGSFLTHLAGAPSVVFGLIGLALFVHGLGLGASLLAGGLALGTMALPAVAASALHALRQVPPDHRSEALALGATRWQVIRRLVLPAAAPALGRGCRTAVVRTVGTAAPLLILGAGSYLTFVPVSPADPLAALPVQLFDWAVQPGAAFAALAAGASIALIAVAAAWSLAMRIAFGRAAR